MRTDPKGSFRLLSAGVRRNGRGRALESSHASNENHLASPLYSSCPVPLEASSVEWRKLRLGPYILAQSDHSPLQLEMRPMRGGKHTNTGPLPCHRSALTL